ncbi:MAG: PhoH family protein [Cyclobacteriaceae bacterium]|nr:PhoH family protein [Cyclobacteriaceae bacterium]
MSERIITLEQVNPVDIYGVNDKKLELLKSYFPKIKLITRGNTMKLVGEEEAVLEMEKKINLMLFHINKFGTLTENNIERILTDSDEENLNFEELSNDIIVYGNSGLVVKAKTVNQRKLIAAAFKNDMVFAIGPAGTGKTYTAVALAVRALRQNQVRKIILTRPAVEAGENLGFLPGDLKEKLDPYLQPLYDALRDMIPPEKLAYYLENGFIQIAPLAFMRGRTLDNAFVILDEAQNATESQLKMFLTRMGKSAKFVITGDLSQIDLPKRQPSGLVQAAKILPNVEGIAFVHLDDRDVIRHKLVRSIIAAYDHKKNNTEKTTDNNTNNNE